MGFTKPILLKNSNSQKITLRYILVGIIAVIFTWVLHEFTHWLTSESLGYETLMRINGTSVVDVENPTDGQQAIISISGPIITLLQGLLVFVILQTRGWNKYLYLFLFTAFYMRFLAGLMNVVNVNDEGRVSQFLGIGTFTLSILVSGILFFMLYQTSKKYGLDWKFQGGTVLITMVASSMLILADQFFGIRIL